MQPCEQKECKMSGSNEQYSWAMFFDGVHILSVNYTKLEVRLFENAGAGAGKLLVKKDEPAEKCSITDALQLLNLGLKFGVSYDLLAQCAVDEARVTLEKLGAKEFLDRMLSLTTEEERRLRFQGFNFAFANGIKEPVLVTGGKKPGK
jgi:hypothetical protein